MATVGSRDVGGGGSEPGVAAVVKSKAQRIGQAIAAARLASMLRRVPVPATPVAEALVVAPVVLHRDILNVVGSPPMPATEVQFVRDADRGLRGYAPCCPAPSLFDLLADAFPDAAPNSVLGTDEEGNWVMIKLEG